jgi:hypothetical protein
MSGRFTGWWNAGWWDVVDGRPGRWLRVGQPQRLLVWQPPRRPLRWVCRPPTGGRGVPANQCKTCRFGAITLCRIKGCCMRPCKPWDALDASATGRLAVLGLCRTGAEGWRPPSHWLEIGLDMLSRSASKSHFVFCVLFACPTFWVVCLSSFFFVLCAWLGRCEPAPSAFPGPG